MEGARILVVEDDRTTADLVALYLRHEGHTVVVEHHGDRARARLETESFDVAVLDVMLPGIDGLSLSRRVRETGRTAILLLSARTREEERLAGFASGADDYVPKPFSPRELVARVQALLRRAPRDDAHVLRRGAMVIDLDRRQVLLDGSGVDLTASEFAVLHALAERPGHVLSRSQLLDRLPGRGGEALDRTIDVHVRNLRRKIATSRDDVSIIETVVGAGYRFAVPVEGGRTG